MPRLIKADPPLPVVFSYATARRAGLTEDQIRHRLESGRWERVARGAYRRADWDHEGLDEFARGRLDHVHRVLAVASRNPTAIVGYESAALLQGLPLVGRPPECVTLLVPPGRWSGSRSGVVFRQLRVPSEDVMRRGVLQTRPVRTWFDIARTRGLADALAVGDAGLREGLMDRADVQAILDREGTTRGCRRARVAFDHLDRARESVLESQSWAYFVRWDLPLPRMQVAIPNASGRFVGRVDFLWSQARLIGECDGRLKYRTAADLYSEKQREDALRAEGYGMVRWSAGDLRDRALAERLRRALSAATPALSGR